MVGRLGGCRTGHIADTDRSTRLDAGTHLHSRAQCIRPGHARAGSGDGLHDGRGSFNARLDVQRLDGRDAYGLGTGPCDGASQYGPAGLVETQKGHRPFGSSRQRRRGIQAEQRPIGDRRHARVVAARDWWRGQVQTVPRRGGWRGNTGRLWPGLRLLGRTTLGPLWQSGLPVL